MSQHTRHTAGQDLLMHADKLTEPQDPRLTYLRAVQTLTKHLQGEVVFPGTPNYEAARIVWNGLVDRHPALIVRCANAADVIAAVTFAREQGMAVSVRSGGHSSAGYSTNDDGMVIDLSRMKAIISDPARRIARLEPGLTWGEVANALQPHGLSLTSGDTATVGVGGLLLGGGIGWMVRKYGLALDHLRAVELVTADGRFLRASAVVHADLFWGLRGGGGNFGIATSFEVEVHPAGIVLGGTVFYEITEAETVLRTYARYALVAPDELTTMALLMAAPPAPFIPPSRQGTPVVAILVCYTGDLGEGERVVAPLRALGTPLADVIAPIPYPVMFTFTQEVPIRGLQQYSRLQFLQTLSDDVLQTLVEEGVAIVSPAMLVQIRILGGAMSRVAALATAFAHRDKQAMVSVFHSEPQPGNSSGQTRVEQVWQKLQPYADRVYMNFLGDEGMERVNEAYPKAVYARLATLKRRYDPTNLFHLNQNIEPATR